LQVRTATSDKDSINVSFGEVDKLTVSPLELSHHWNRGT
jgi:hypothetical protein